jgi:hypothetical protein
VLHAAGSLGIEKPILTCSYRRQPVTGEGQVHTKRPVHPLRAEDAARLPCFATFRSAPAMTKASQEILVCLSSPPVGCVQRGAIDGQHNPARLERIARALPVISFTVSPFIRSATGSSNLRG